MKKIIRLLTVGLLVVFGSIAGSTAPALAQSVPIDVNLDDAASVNGSVTVSSVTIVEGKAVITGSLSATVTVAGVSGKVEPQSFTLTVAATCKSGTGTLTLTTSRITAALSNGTTATIEPETLTISATCGRTPTLTVTVAPATATISDGTTITTSQCTVTASTRSNTALGQTICQVQTFICELAEDIAAGSTGELVTLLNKILNSAQSIA